MDPNPTKLLGNISTLLMYFFKEDDISTEALQRMKATTYRRDTQMNSSLIRSKKNDHLN